MNREETKLAYADLVNKAVAEGQVKEVLAELGRNDLFFFLFRILKRIDIDKDWLFDRCREVQKDPNGRLDLWAREHYKALDVDTPVRTTSGWKRHGDLWFGDCVYAPSGRIVQVIANTGAMVGVDCYNVGGVIAGGDHRWPVQVKHRARAVGGRDVFYETVTMTTRDMGTVRLPNARPLQGVSVENMVVPPYVLGVWLGDGHSSCGRVTSGDDELWGLLDWEFSTGSVPITKNIKGLMPLLRSLGVLNNKHIPDAYLSAHPRDRLALLQGLMDTDGHVSTRGTATFCNTNENLVDGVSFLANSLGMRSRKRRYEVVGKNGYWQVSFQAYKDCYCPFRLSRKVERCKIGSANMRHVTPHPVETRPVNCIQVLGGEYLAGKDLIPTCNSTIISFALTLQDILNDPELTIGIFSLTRPMSKRLLRQIKVECETNDLLFELYPDVMWKDPVKESPKWSEDDGLVFKRKSNPSESTVEAWGLVDAMPTGKHFKVRIYDDIIDERNVTSPEMIKKAVNAWELSLNLGSIQPVKKYQDINIARHIGTRYHYNDPYSTIMKRNVAVPRIYPATHDGTMEGDPVLWTQAFLDEKRKSLGPYIFGCQLLLNPVADIAEGFKLNWVQRYNRKEDTHEGMNLYILVDPAGEKKRDHSYTVILVIGLGSDKNYYLVDGIRDRINLTERAAKVFAFHRQYEVVAVGYEKYSMQADIEHIKDKQERENYRFPIVQLGGQTAKDDRIKKLIPLFENNRFWLPQTLYFLSNDGKQHDLVDEFINEEYLPFPVGYKDTLDCMARIVDPELNAKFPMENMQHKHSSRSLKKKAYEPYGSLRPTVRQIPIEYPRIIG